MFYFAILRACHHPNYMVVGFTIYLPKQRIPQLLFPELYSCPMTRCTQYVYIYIGNEFPLNSQTYN